MLQIAVLKLDRMDDMCCLVECGIGSLVVQTMDLVSPVVEKDAVADAIRAAWSRSEFVYQRRLQLREWLRALHREAEQRARDCWRDYEQYNRVHEEECRKIILCCRSLVERIEGELEGRMTERQRRVYRLGRMLEQVTHRGDAYWDTFVWFPPEEDGKELEPAQYFAVGRPQTGTGFLPQEWLLEWKTRCATAGSPSQSSRRRSPCASLGTHGSHEG